MKLTIPRSSLVSALAIVKPAARKGPAILGNVHLFAAGEDLVLTCSDLELSIRTRIEANFERRGATTVRAALLYDLVKSLSTSEVCLEFTPVGTQSSASPSEGMLIVASGLSKYQLGTLPTTEFPEFPALKGKNDVAVFMLPEATLRTLLAETAFCQGTDQTRPALLGSLLRLNGNLCVAGCDGRRVAVEHADIEEKTGQAVDLVVPPRAISELLRLLSANADDQKPVTITAQKNLVSFDFQGTTLISKLIDGDYPDYTRVIPKDLRGGVPIGRADLLAALKRVSLLADAAALEFRGQMLTIRSHGTRDNIPGEAVESLLIPKTPDMTTLFNPKFLIEALSAVPDDEVHFIPQGSHLPAIIKSPSRSWTCVTAALTPAESKPVRTQSSASPSQPGSAGVSPAKPGTPASAGSANPS